MFSSDVDGGADIRQPSVQRDLERERDRLGADRDRDRDRSSREQHQEREREREREREQRYRNREKLAQAKTAAAATSVKHQHPHPHQQHQPTQKSRPSPTPSSHPTTSHSHPRSHSHSQSESSSPSHSSDDGVFSRSSSSWFTSRVRGAGAGSGGAGSGSGRGGRGYVSVGSKSKSRSSACGNLGSCQGMIHSIMNVRFLFPFLLGFILGVLVMCAFILIDPALHQRLHHSEQSHNNIETTTETAAAAAGVQDSSTSRLKSMLTKAADSVQCPVCNCPAGAGGLGLSVPGGVIKACPACPPPVCSTASAGVLNRKRGMPRWSRWMRDTFLGHMVNFTDEWRKKPDQIMHQLNYLINADANYDNVQKLRFLDPFLDGVTDPALANARWLTVADGYFGMEGAYVHRRARDLRRDYLAVHPSAKVPNIHVTGTALSNMTLRYALKYEYVDAISEENVEDLSFDDESFDYVLIKEAFHHLTRPYMGLYELIRVARHGVILVEPAEIPGRPPSYWSSNPPYARSLVIPDVVIGFESDLIQFRLSVHELQKVAMALNLPAVAVKGLNNPMGSRYNRTIYFKDLENLNQLGLEGKRPFNLVAAVVFKQKPSKTLQDAMIKDHFLFLDVPYTPFPYDDYSVSYN